MRGYEAVSTGSAVFSLKSSSSSGLCQTDGDSKIKHVILPEALKLILSSKYLDLCYPLSDTNHCEHFAKHMLAACCIYVKVLGNQSTTDALFSIPIEAKQCIQ